MTGNAWPDTAGVRRPRRWWLGLGLALSGFFALVTIAGVALLLLGIALFNVPSASNEPTLRVGDNFLAVCYDTDCRFRLLPFLPRLQLMEPAQGDVAVFSAPSNPSVTFVKRIVGMPGDTVQMRDGLLFINGKAVAERQVGEYPLAEASGEDERRVPQYEEELPNGVRHQLIRIFPENALANTDVFKVPPGHYFVMGDNRDNSSDSRDPNGEVGFVPRQNMIARAYLVTFSTVKLGRGLIWVDLPPGSSH